MFPGLLCVCALFGGTANGAAVARCHRFVVCCRDEHTLRVSVLRHLVLVVGACVPGSTPMSGEAVCHVLVARIAYGSALFLRRVVHGPVNRIMVHRLGLRNPVVLVSLRLRGVPTGAAGNALTLRWHPPLHR